MSANKNAQLINKILERCLKDFSRMYGINDLTDAVNYMDWYHLFATNNEPTYLSL